MKSSDLVDEYTLEPHVVRRAFDRASRSYANAAGVQSEIRARLLERLDLVKLVPARVLDLGAASGQSSRELKRRYPKAEVLAIDISVAMLHEAARQQGFWHRFRRVAASAQNLPLRNDSIDLAVSNLMLAWCNEPDAVFAETARVLRAEGLFMFTTLGPDTLRELRDAFRLADTHPHVHRFIDMHDIGDALMRCGFSEPVMDTERLTVTYPSARALMLELRASGAVNATAGRRKIPLRKAQLASVEAALERRRSNGVLPFTIEVVYGHAWRAEFARQRRDPAGEIAISIDSIRRRKI
jgi:malonyl-CoA O-methyltransferase